MSAVRDAASELRTVAMPLDHPEAVAWPEGSIWCGTEAGDLLRVDPATGTPEIVASTGGFLLGLAFDGSGNCYACDQGRDQVLRISPHGEVDAFVEAVDGSPLCTPNFPVFSADGTLWVTDSGSAWEADDGYLFRVRPGHDPERITTDPLGFPNGLALSSDESTLYVVEPRLPGVVAYAIDGMHVGQRSELVRLPGTVPDGLAVDAEHTLYVSCWRPDRIYRLRLNVEPETYLDDPTAEYLCTPTNVCFGGSELTVLYIASLGGWAISAIQTDVPGQPLRYPRL
jgi:gluconolactonase